jgi:hypothetical protein
VLAEVVDEFGGVLVAGDSLGEDVSLLALPYFALFHLLLLYFM